MIKYYAELDSDGSLIAFYNTDINHEIPESSIELSESAWKAYFESGFIKPRWTGSEWIEGLSQEEIDELDNPTKEQEIITAKRQLEETDYKIIKSSEYQLLGLEVPYNLEELHAERQALRDNINELENL